MHKVIEINNLLEWLQRRHKGIGGSDAAAVIGKNPHKTNLDLWREKTGRKSPQDISSKSCVMYGKRAEDFLRELFMLDYPQYAVNHEPYNIHIHLCYPFVCGTFDGILTDKTAKEKGLLEIKTTTIRNFSDWQKWDNQIPENYFCQILHYMAIDEDFKFTKLKAQITSIDKNNEVTQTTRHYHFKREDYLDDINYLLEKEAEFWWYVENDKEPPLILPEI